MRSRNTPERLGKQYNHGFVAQLTDDPVTLNEVKNRKDWAQWKEAMDTELKALQEFGTFSHAKLPPGRKAIPCKWVFKIKRNEKGQILKYRARLVAKGFKQIAGQDFSEVFAPVSKHATFRTLLSIVASNDLDLHHIDVKTAFMNGDLQEEIYMQPPPGWEGESSTVWRLHKGVNGLKQAARAWNEKLTTTVQKLGFHPSNSDVSLYISGTPPNACYLLCYVDDILIAGSLSMVERVKRQIADIFKCDDMGQASLFLGMKIIRDRAQRKLWVGQSHYVIEILERAGLKDCRPRKTPLDANLSLSKDSGEPAPESLDEYQELVGCLLYLTDAQGRTLHRP
jgi:Reverse transcriptase (RNA-dependent DNA polymerase)